MLTIRSYGVVRPVVILALLIATIAIGRSFTASSQSSTFTFTAVGDFGTSTWSKANLQSIGASDSRFTLALGDLSYGQVSESAWCGLVKSYVGDTYPFQLVSGNHDDDEGGDGHIHNFRSCLPDRMSSQGDYGSQYYFDYQNVRVIMVPADLVIGSVTYNYDVVGSSRYNWVRDRIREGKAAGRWVVVGMHKNCITVGDKTDCSVGRNFMNMMATEKVDLILQAHDHTYQRSKQLRCVTTNSYDSSCVVDNGADNLYTRGNGPVIVFSGGGGDWLYQVKNTDTEAGYFVKAMGNNAGYNLSNGTSVSGYGYGYVKFTVSADRIDAEWVMTTQVNSGTRFADSFSIVGAGGPTNTPTPPIGASNTPTPVSGSNLALGRPASASSVEATGFEAGRAVDGNATTRWASLEGVDPQWIQVDLGSTQSISRVRLTWEAAYASSYQVQTSGAASGPWTTIYSTTSGNGGVDDLTGLTGSGRYLRVNGTARGTAYGYSLYELEVYGGAGPTATRTRTNTSTGPSATRTNTSVGPSPTRTPTNTSTPGTCLTATLGGTWQNSGFANQSGTFTAEFDLRTSASPTNSNAGLSLNAASAYTSVAAGVRLNPSGMIDARNGGAFAAAVSMPYSANSTYHVRLVVNVPAHTYSVYVTPPGGAETLLGSNYAFRTEQSAVASLNNLALYVGSTGAAGSSMVCSLTISGGVGPSPTATRTRTNTLVGPSPTRTRTNTPTSGGGTPVGINGQLHVCGRTLCNQYGRPIQLRGMSTHGIQWYGNCINNTSLDALANDWKSDILRISLYVQEDGYETNPAGFRAQVDTIVDAVVARGMYIILDWHMLDPGDPMYNLARAKEYFAYMAQKHGSKPNIIYEIANEPNADGNPSGVVVDWARIKSYAEQVIPVIRQHDPDGVILIGTPDWSSFGVSGSGGRASAIVANPVSGSNLMYTFHFYAASHLQEYRDELAWAADRLPVFVSEWGTQEYTGDGPNNFTSSQAYIDLMAQKKISWTSWNYSDNSLTGAAFLPGTCPGGPFTGTSRLKPAGVWVRDKILNPPDNFPTS